MNMQTFGFPTDLISAQQNQMQQRFSFNFWKQNEKDFTDKGRQEPTGSKSLDNSGGASIVLHCCQILATTDDFCAYKYITS